MATLGREESSHCNPLSPPKVTNINFLLKISMHNLSREKVVRINKMITNLMNNDLIFYQILSTTCNKLVLMPGIPCNSERDWSIRLDSLHTLLCQSICPSFVDFVLCFRSNMKWQQKLQCKFIFYKKENGSWIWKTWRCPKYSKFQYHSLIHPMF